MIGERGMGIRAGAPKQSWEESDFPILCESCLGENPYVRMLKSPAQKECKICVRPFTNFRWKAGPQGRYKNTEVCQTCAKLKNVCQTCLLDLHYHLPVQVRDKYLGEKQVAIPTQEANKNFFIEQVNRSVENLALPYQEQAGNKVLEELARNRAKPYYARNLPHICSFFVKGECKRGSECPYRHEMPSEESLLAKQNTVDRYHGRNDPVANKIIGRANDNQRIKAPEDRNITTAYLKDLPSNLTEQDLSDMFKKYGDVDAVKFLNDQKSAFVVFESRNACEKAIKELHGNLVIKSQSVQIMWAKSDKGTNQAESEVAQDKSLLVPQYVPSMMQAPVNRNPNIKPPMLPPPDVDVSALNQNKFIDQISQIGNATYYPSMDPNSLGGLRSNKK